MQNGKKSRECHHGMKVSNRISSFVSKDRGPRVYLGKWKFDTIMFDKIGQYMILFDIYLINETI